MIDYSIIPEEDRVCVNCDYLGDSMDTGDEYMCGGVRPCINYHKNNSKNYFLPDDFYLEHEYGCEACSLNGSEACARCSKSYSDKWERCEVRK